ncbi:hypothetical protein B0T17DRAFT_599195 [Bombardia bombarda]|uniref:Uncharacterized protein n=1 Tax=Bombardia bombarda TaxID=252184 RepID=A0AA39XC03_9PEZI|nr:hypothetical protein B0T17DRAFT_599195 [Bombardia bombarda]
MCIGIEYTYSCGCSIARNAPYPCECEIADRTGMYCWVLSHTVKRERPEEGLCAGCKAAFKKRIMHRKAWLETSGHTEQEQQDDRVLRRLAASLQVDVASLQIDIAALEEIKRSVPYSQGTATASNQNDRIFEELPTTEDDDTIFLQSLVLSDDQVLRTEQVSNAEFIKLVENFYCSSELEAVPEKDCDTDHPDKTPD